MGFALSSSLQSNTTGNFRVWCGRCTGWDCYCAQGVTNFTFYTAPLAPLPKNVRWFHVFRPAPQAKPVRSLTGPALAPTKIVQHYSEVERRRWKRRRHLQKLRGQS